MTIKQYMQVLVETITGRKCENCKYLSKNDFGWYLCSHDKSSECVERIYPKYWEKKRSNT